MNDLMPIIGAAVAIGMLLSFFAAALLAAAAMLDAGSTEKFHRAVIMLLWLVVMAA